jgi:hypothetical protein
MRQHFLALLLAACGSGELGAPPKPMTSSDAAAPAELDPRRWFGGDVHMHVAPPDDPHDVVMNVEQIADAALAAGLDFVVLTPHLWHSRWGAEFRRQWGAFANDARAIAKPTMIPGVEWGDRDGHFTIAGVAIDTLRGDFLAAAHDAGAFISTNHPFALPTKIPGVRVSHFDMSYRPWTERRRTGFTAIDGAEVWNVPLGLANLLSQPGGRTGEARTWTELDRVVHTERRPVTAVGGTDNHRMHVTATTWVLAVDATATSILDALVRGATCVGGPEGGSFRARGDDGPWVHIGESVVARTITLAWDGVARLFIDDVDQGEHAGGFVHDTGAALHTYRIVVGSSRCGFIYANLSPS